MSWQHFVKESKYSQSLEELLNLLAKKSTNQNLNSKVDKANTITAAQYFMDSFVDYTSTKLWFQDWLLPQLGISPER